MPPTPVVLDLLNEMRTFLVSEGIVRVPATAGDGNGNPPPLWLSPRRGTPAPGEGQNPNEVGKDVVLGAFLNGGIAPGPYESEWRTDFIDFRIRTRLAPQAPIIADKLRAAFVDKRNWEMAGLTIIESMIFRELQPLGSDEQGFDWALEFSFDRYTYDPTP